MYNHNTNVVRKGFTIVELLIVIVVIAILAAISLVAYNGTQARANDSKRVNDFSAIQKALRMYYVDNGRYPACGTHTATRGGCAMSGIASHLVPKYISKLPADPVSTGSTDYGYWYAWGYKKSGPMSHVNTDSDQDYSIGTYLEVKGCPCNSHWSARINHMEGTI